MEIPTNSISIYRDELSITSAKCSYSPQGCTTQPRWVYTIGMGLNHAGGNTQLHACEVHDRSVHKHAERIVQLTMSQIRAVRSANGEGVIIPAALSAQMAEQAQQQINKDALPGHQREAPGSNPPPRRQGEIAQGHPVSNTTPDGDRFDPGHVDVHLWQQPPKEPRNFPVITPIIPHDGQALGSSIWENAAIHHVNVQYLDAAGASQVKPLPGHPTGSPAEAATADQQFRTAPSGTGQQFRENGQRPAGNAYLSMPGEGIRS